MTGRVRHRLVASVLVAALGTACGGEGANKEVHPRATEPRQVTAPRPIASSTTTTSTTKPPVRSADESGVRPPPVIDHGTDHVAITRSLLIYARWLDAHDPDQALLTRAYQQGSAMARSVASDWVTMRRKHWRIIEIDRSPFGFTVLSETSALVSYRMVEHLAYRDLIDVNGRAFRHDGPRDETYLISVIQIVPGASWRLLDIVRKGPPIEVQL